jgi:DNA-binding transcriptional ArsR family regulator
MERFYPMSQAVAARADLAPASKCIHAVLSAFARMESGAHPSQETIGAALAISARHVRNGLRQLEKAGLIERQRRGVLQSNSYRLLAAESSAVRNDCSVRNISSVRNDSSAAVRNDCSDHYGTIVPTNRAKNRLIEASASDAEPMIRQERLQWLRETLGNFNPDLGQPDAAITEKIEAAAGGASEDAIEAALHRLFDAGLQDRMRSWGLMVKALPDELAKPKATRRSEPERGSYEALIRGEVIAGRITREEAAECGVQIPA